MRTYESLIVLAEICAFNARLSTDTNVALELLQMANEYRAEAAKLAAPRGAALVIDLVRGRDPARASNS